MSYLQKKSGLSGKTAIITVVDLMDESSIAKGLEESIFRFGQVDILLNGAGGNRGKGLRC